MELFKSLILVDFKFCHHIDKLAEIEQLIRSHNSVIISCTRVIDKLLSDFTLSVCVFSQSNVIIDTNILKEKIDTIAHVSILYMLRHMKQHENYSSIIEEKYADFRSRIGDNGNVFRVTPLTPSSWAYSQALAIPFDECIEMSRQNGEHLNPDMYRAMLLCAVIMNRFELMKQIISYAEQNNVVIDIYEVFILVNHERQEEMFNYLLDRDDFKINTQLKDILVHLFMKVKDRDTIDKLLSKHIDIQDVDLLTYAILSYDYDVFEYIISKVKDINIVKNYPFEGTSINRKIFNRLTELGFSID